MRLLIKPSTCSIHVIETGLCGVTMPIYEYGCESCGHAFERLQKISDDPIKDCPTCEGLGSVKKLVSRTSFVLKGSGWYADGYSGKSNKGDGSSSAGSSDSGSASTSSSD